MGYSNLFYLLQMSYLLFTTLINFNYLLSALEMTLSAFTMHYRNKLIIIIIVKAKQIIALLSPRLLDEKP